MLGALATKAKDVGDYLDKLAEKARSRSKGSAGSAEGTRASTKSPLARTRVRESGYGGPDPESDRKAMESHEDQGT